MGKDEILKGLTLTQQKAVTYGKGPLLLVAGAGCGKTEIIIRKAAYLLEVLNIVPSSLLILVRSNRAAYVIKKEIGKVVSSGLDEINITTIENFCRNILRSVDNIPGFTKNFTIYDESDSCALLRSILKELKIHEALYKSTFHKISYLKNSLITPTELLDRDESFGFEEKFSRIYVRYIDELKRNNSIDCDDLLLLTIKLFKEDRQLLDKYRKEISHILYDDFHDATDAQYTFLRLISEEHKNICATADTYQGFNKSSENSFNSPLLLFEKDFPNAKTIVLDKNLRSTQNILEAATTILNKNGQEQTIPQHTLKERGQHVCCCITNTDEEEAFYIARTIKEFFLKGRYSYKDFAIFFRVGQQCRSIEDALKIEGLPYKIVDGLGLFQKKEVKDILAYLKVIFNISDAVSLKRIINCPPRGISHSVITKLENETRKKDDIFIEVLRQHVENSSSTAATYEKLKEFIKLLDELTSIDTTDTKKLLRLVIDKTGYRPWFEKNGSALLEKLDISIQNNTLHGFLDNVVLENTIDEEPEEDAVSLMTLYSAKGCEFPVVFISGLEDGLIPHFQAIKNELSLKEERKLFYVGMTRARDLLLLTGARKRKLYASLQEQEPSRFIKELPQSCCRFIEKKPREKSFMDDLSTKSVSKEVTFPNGTRVKHPRWGVGIVRESYGDGVDRKIMVNFPSVGVKKLSIKFANLERM
jgi:DNA helicase-2/ATP-dependent DNA helicase PcrA